MEFVKLTDLPYYEQGPYVFSVWLPEVNMIHTQTLCNWVELDVMCPDGYFRKFDVYPVVKELLI